MTIIEIMIGIILALFILSLITIVIDEISKKYSYSTEEYIALLIEEDN